MANLHLVTGYAGESHVTSADQGTFHTAIFGSEQVVLGKGNKLAASVNGNTVTILDGDILMQGRYIRLAEGKSVNLVIEEGKEEKVRNDLIVARYTKNEITAIEECNLVVIKGTETEGVATDPEYISGNILDGDLVNDMPLYRVTVNGLAVRTPEVLFEVFDTTVPEIPITFDKKLANKQDRTDILATDNEIDDGDTMPYFKRTDGTHKAVPWGIMKSKISAAFDNPEQVGDLKSTIRTDVGDKYLLANGAEFKHSEYPSLTSLCPAKLRLDKPTDCPGVMLYDVEYNDGIWVAIGCTSAGVPWVFTTTDPREGAWTANQIDESTTVVLSKVAYGGGVWAAVGYRTSDSYPCIYTTTDPTGTWTLQIIEEAASTLNCIAFGDGTWVAVGDSYRYINTTNATGTWTKQSGGGDWIAFGDGTWLRFSGYATPYSTTDPTGTWTTGKSFASSNVPARAVYANGVWVAQVWYDGGFTTYTHWTTDLTATWTKYQLSSSTHCYAWDLAVLDNGQIIVPMGYRSDTEIDAWYVNIPPLNGGSSTSRTYSSVTSNVGFNFMPSGIATDGEMWVAVGYDVDKGNTTTQYIFGNFKPYLPTITSMDDDAYVYIRAKE